MIYLAKSFTCVIVSRWRTYVDIYFFLKYIELGEFRVCSESSFQSQQQRAKGNYNKVEFACIVCKFEALRNGYDEVLPTVAGTREVR